MNFIKRVCEIINLKKQKDRQKKLYFLSKEAYRYYLIEFIKKITENKKPDFHPELYQAGLAISTEAMRNASMSLSYIIKHKKIDECYKKRITELKKRLRAG